MPLPATLAAAFVLLLVPGAFAATHQINQTGLTWVPNDLTIDVGDTVEWIFSAGSHTVTEGTDDATPPIGSKLFDEPLNAGSPLVSYTFDTEGDVDFYCRPHLMFGMTGVIHVQAASTSAPDGESRAWSQVKNLYR
jgi:plastocyanin